MSLKKIYVRLIQMFFLFSLIFLLFAETLAAFAVIFSISAAILIFQMWLSNNSKKTKLLFSLTYILILVLQQVFTAVFVFSNNDVWIIFMMKKLVAILFIFIPFVILYLHYLYTLQHQFSSQGESSISFNLLREIQKNGMSIKNNVKRGKSSLSKNNLDEIMQDIPRHSYTKYLSKDSLTEQYFQDCEKSLSDENLYIVISSTGSSASEVISLFTQKEYNHVSLSFDKDLKTTISYNGGENLTLPGLNQEQVSSFNKKKDASIIVYKMFVPKEQKQMVINKIREINTTGSAYNLVGLVTKISIKPNIMFCSQFVYSVLKSANLEFFKSNETNVKPTDFVEKDYYRKLQFCYEIKFDEDAAIHRSLSARSS